MRVSILCLSLFGLLICSCRYFGGERISGSGHVITKSMNIGAFDGVHVSGHMSLRLVQNSSAGVSVQTDDNLFEHIDIYIDGNILIVKSKDGVNLDPTGDIVIYASAPAFRRVEVSGSGDVDAENITGSQPLSVVVSGSGDIRMNVHVPKIDAEISGSGTITLKGAATDFNTRIDGSGEVRSFELASDNTTIDLSGSADAEVRANKSLDIHISGSGSVQYRGNPSVKQQVSGSGSVEKVG